jgi:hypothetical protein
LIVGGVALWGALTGKDPAQPTAASPSAGAAKSSAPAHDNPTDNTIMIHCLAVQCPLFVAGPGPTDVQFKGNLARGDRRIFSDTRLVVSVDDASTVTVTINGRVQPRGRRGESKTYEVPASQ